MPSQPTAQQPAIHWIGAGLSSGPGIVALANKWRRVTVWDMSSERADSLRQHLQPPAEIFVRRLDLNDETSRAAFCAALKPGDIIVSMLPASFHVQVARLALAENCHMVTSSYLSDEMTALDDEARQKGLSVVNEVGLDPGIDHLLTHILVDAARRAGILGQGHTLDFISYCGGVPVEKTPFTYKFSWTPLGVLTALKNPALMIRDGRQHAVERAWNEVDRLAIEGEEFEVYPNRNSLPYIAEYGLDGESGLRTFVRGTLRLSGWKDAWKDIFSTIEKADMAELKSLSDRLWREHPYAAGEKDRVVLHVALTATDKTTGDAAPKWHGALSLDQTGSGWRSAMARCVSLTVAEAVGALRQGRLKTGVQTAPHDIAEAKSWLRGLKRNGIEIKTSNVDLEN